jgi:hypothetical protein
VTRDRGAPFALSLHELNGTLGDLGTLLPLMLGAIAVGGLAPAPVLLGFALFYLTTAWHYRLPIPVQPMKAVTAVLLTGSIAPATMAASGVLMGLALLILGLTGAAKHLARLVAQSVLAGLQLGLGIALGLVGLRLMASAPAIAFVTVAVLLSLQLLPRVPAALVALGAATLLSQAIGGGSLPLPATASPVLVPALPDLAAIGDALQLLVLPQLPLTITNAVLLTALVAGDYFGERARHVTPARLAITSGLANLLLTPFGALPMCHGAGGLASHHRFGARTGTAPLLLGAILAILAVMPGDLGPKLLNAIPAAGLGALLVLASAELGLSRRLFDCKPSCWPVIAVTAAATLWLDPFWGLLLGSGAEIVRGSLVRRLQRDAPLGS